MSRKIGIILLVSGVCFMALALPAVWRWTDHWANEIALGEYGKPLENLSPSQVYLVSESGPVVPRALVFFAGFCLIFFGALSLVPEKEKEAR